MYTQYFGWSILQPSSRLISINLLYWSTIWNYSSKKFTQPHHCYIMLWAQVRIYGTWWRGLFIYKICTYKHEGAVDSYWDGMTQCLQRSSDQLWNWCHVELLHFARLKRVTHDTRHLCQCILTYVSYRITSLSPRIWILKALI